MSNIYSEFKNIWSRKNFFLCVFITTLVSFVTQLISPTVGIDDTAYKLYFIDGVAPAAGRWLLFLVKYVCPLDYNPYFMELLGMVFFSFSVCLWSLVFERIFKDKVASFVYTLAAMAFVSSPILAEVSVWYLQNGIFVGYGIVALSLLFFDEGMKTKEWKEKCMLLLGSAGLLTAAVGLYESFILVFVMGVILIYAGGRIFENAKAYQKTWQWAAGGAGCMVIMLALRTVIMKSMEIVFHLKNQKLLNTRGFFEVFAWFGKDRTIEDFFYLVKSFFVKYYVVGIIYFPVFVAALSMIALALWLLIYGIKKKDAWLLVSALAIVLLPLGMSFMEGVASYYRSAQYVPLVTAFACLLAGYEIERKKKTIFNILGCMVVFVLLYNQCYDMNRWFYIEKIKYEDAKKTVSDLSYYLEQNGLEEKPICLVGNYEMPDILWEEMSVPNWSKKYLLTRLLVDAIDPTIMREYETKVGMAAAETPKLNFMNWGKVAFHTYDRELCKFAKMHGLQLREDLNTEHYLLAEEALSESKVFPDASAIKVYEDFVAIRIGE